MADNKVLLRGTTSDGAAVTVGATTLHGLMQIAGWDHFAESVDSVLRRYALRLPADYRTPVRNGGDTVWRIAPTKVLVRSEARLDVSAGSDLVALDLSDARVCLNLRGPGAGGLLARLAAVDFSERAFAVGTFVQTGIHHVGVLIDRPGADEFDLMVPCTWARSLIDLVACHLHPTDA